NRGFDLALGVTTPAERGLPENGTYFRGKHRAADYFASVGRPRLGPTCSQSFRHKMNPNCRNRCVVGCTVFIGRFIIFSYRLIYLQAIKHDEYAGLAAEKHVYRQIIHAERGKIFDANKEVLANNVPVETVVADATHLNNRQAIVALVSRELGLSSRELAQKLDGERRYIVIKREVPTATATVLREKLLAANLRGIYFEQDATRIYPNGAMLCHVIGFTDFDHHGIQGVEASMEEYLHGQDGYRF